MNSLTQLLLITYKELKLTKIIHEKFCREIHLVLVLLSKYLNEGIWCYIYCNPCKVKRAHQMKTYVTFTMNKFNMQFFSQNI